LLVAPAHRPTLREELAALPARGRAVAIAALALFVVAAAAIAVLAVTPSGTHVVRERPVPFNLRYDAPMREVAPQPGELLRLAHGRLETFTVSPLRLPPYRGKVDGVLPVVADREWADLRRRFPGLKPAEDGKARLNLVAGYGLLFRLPGKPKRFGRLVLLPRPVAGARDGVKLLLLGGPATGNRGPRSVGNEGTLDRAYHSFTFGTEGA
jgi:hypothetical protein